MSYTSPQSLKEQKYWTQLKNHSYYLCTEYPSGMIDIYDVWRSKSDAARSARDYARENPHGQRRNVVARFSAKQMDDIIQTYKKHMFGSEWTKHRWDTHWKPGVPFMKDFINSTPTWNKVIEYMVYNWKNNTRYDW